MKAGLFICDHVAPQYQNQFGDYPSMFAKLFPDFDWVLYEVCNNQFPKNLNECDLYMATGSKHAVYDDFEWIKQLKHIIVELYQQQKPFVGVCFGHQLIGEALGGKVQKSSKGWCVGVHDFQITATKDWMKPASPKINLLMMCQDQIVELPPNATVLAKSALCPIAMLTVGNCMLGIQAHPEFSKAYNRQLMEDRIELMGEAVVHKGIESLDKVVHAEVIQAWVERFVLRD